MRSRNDSRHNPILDIAAVNLNVLCMLMKGRIADIEKSTLIITMCGHWRRRRDVEIFKI